MSFFIGLIIGAASMYAYQRGMLDTPIAAVVDLVRNWGKK
jgi:hypothetical protein